MNYVSTVKRDIKQNVEINKFRILNITKQKFKCPVCDYYGPFVDINPPTGLRKHAACQKCNSLERHRLQKLVLDKVLYNSDLPKLRMLHFAPERFFQSLFKDIFEDYTTTDLYREDVEVKADMLCIAKP